jgi:microcystin-dependent protein
MGSSAIGITGGNMAHNNVMPYFAVSFIIALQGIYPSQN